MAASIGAQRFWAAVRFLTLCSGDSRYRRAVRGKCTHLTTTPAPLRTRCGYCVGHAVASKAKWISQLDGRMVNGHTVSIRLTERLPPHPLTGWTSTTSDGRAGPLSPAHTHVVDCGHMAPHELPAEVRRHDRRLHD